MANGYESSVLLCYDSPDHCQICRFIDGDRSETAMMAVIKQLDSKLSKTERAVSALVKTMQHMETNHG